jgi:hypothetical protein
VPRGSPGNKWLICIGTKQDCSHVVKRPYNANMATRNKLCGDDVFVWPKSVMSWFTKKHNTVMAKVTEEQLLLIDYLLEYCIELCLDQTKDISMNPGWEKKYFLKKKDK